MSISAIIHVLCETNPSLATSVVNGLLAWAEVLGGCTVLFSGRGSRAVNLASPGSIVNPGSHPKLLVDQPRDLGAVGAAFGLAHDVADDRTDRLGVAPAHALGRIPVGRECRRNDRG
jgi:hypothetical protein